MPATPEGAACPPAQAPWGARGSVGRSKAPSVRLPPTSDPGGGQWLCGAPPPPGEGSSVARIGGAISRPTLCHRRYGRPSTTPAAPAVTQASDRSRRACRGHPPFGAHASQAHRTDALASRIDHLAMLRVRQDESSRRAKISVDEAGLCAQFIRTSSPGLSTNSQCRSARGAGRGAYHIDFVPTSG